MKSELGAEATAGRYAFGDFQLDPAARLLTSGPDRSPVAIKGKAFDALVFFVLHAGTLVTRSALIEALWPRTVVEDNNLNKLIATLRRGLGDSEGRRFIVTVQGRGYQFVAPVHRLADEAAKTETEPKTVRPAPLTALSAGAAIGLSVLAVMALRPEAEPSASAWPGPVTRVSPVTTFPGDEWSPSLSPDGSQVTFSWDGDSQNRDIYVMPVGGASPLRLTQDPAVDRDPSWSPDGSHIAFLRQRDQVTLDLVVVPALGGKERLILGIHMQFISREGAPRIAWTADSRQLIFTTQFDADIAVGSHHLYRVSLDRGDLFAMTSGEGVYDSSPALSPDGSKLAFTRFRVGERLSQLMIQPLDENLRPKGQPEPLTNLPADIPHSPAWSRDSKHLVFVSGSDIYSWSAKPGMRRVHAAAGVLGGYQLNSIVSALSLGQGSTAVRAVAAKIDRSQDIWAMPLDPRTRAATGPPRVRASSTASEAHPRLSPDGSQLAFVSSRSGQAAVWIADADGSDPRQVTSLASVVTGFPHWSPDGRQLAFHASFPGQARQVYVIDVEGGMPRPLGNGCCPEWSADGRHLWISDISSVSHIARLRMDDGLREMLFVGEMAHETPDGKRLIYAKSSQAGLFQRSPLGNPADNPEVRLVDDHTPPVGGIAPAADGFFYISSSAAGTPRALRFYDYRHEQARDIAPVPGSAGHGMSLSPDGREILYTAGAEISGADLVLLEFEGREDQTP